MKKFYEQLCVWEGWIARVFLVGMVLLIFAAAIARLMAHPINWAIDIATAMFAWACLFAADVAWRHNKLMSVDILTNYLSDRARAILAHSQPFDFDSLSLVRHPGRHMAVLGQPGAFVPGHPPRSLTPGSRWRCRSAGVLLLITTALKVREDPRLNARQAGPAELTSDLERHAHDIVFFAFIILLAIGMPVAFAIGISGALFFIQNPNLPFTMPVQLTVTQTQNFALLAIPMFILSGNLMNVAGITERMLRLSTVLTGHMRGGRRPGVARARHPDGLGVGLVHRRCRHADPHPRAEMLKRNFTKGYAAAVLSFGFADHADHPPGIGYILYGTVGQVSIGRLFAGGIVPGLMLWGAMAVTLSDHRQASSRSRRSGRAGRKSRRSIGATVNGVWAILFPVMLIVSLRAGVFTPSEVGAFGGRLRLPGRHAGTAASSTRTPSTRHSKARLSTSAAVMFLIALSGIFGYGIAWDQVPDKISRGHARHLHQSLSGDHSDHHLPPHRRLLRRRRRS